MGEFDLIERYFKRPATRAALGVGDDCALLRPTPGTQLAISSDMLVENRHFFADVDPATLGHKALAVNLSDLAACGATPLAFTLALALPRADETWLAAFSSGLFALADAHGCELIGGDTTQGPLNICITVFGEVPVLNGKSRALLRSGAKPGDDVYVSGTLGDARLALDALRGTLTLPTLALPLELALTLPPALFAQAKERLERPTPRIALGQALRGVATAALDLSDGLLGDLTHILKASGVGATLDTSLALDLLAARRHADWTPSLVSAQKQLECVLSGGDDYELAFTAPPSARDAVLAASHQSATPVTRMGRIELEPGLRLVDGQGQRLNGQFFSFDHFA